MASLLDYFTDGGQAPQSQGLLGMDDPRTMMRMGLAGGMMMPGSQPRRQTFGEALATGMGSGMQAYAVGRQLQDQRADRETRNRMLQEEVDMRRSDRETKAEERAKAEQRQAAILEYLRARDPSGQLVAAYMIDPKSVGDRILPPQLQFDKIDPLKATPESVQAAMQAGDPSMLRPRQSIEFVNGVAVDKNAVQPGMVLPNPNQPFSLGPDGRPVANTAFQDYDLRRQRAGASSVTQVNEGQRGFTNTRDLRTEYSGLPETKAYKEMQTTASIVQSALKNPSPANDLAAATKFMKMLDPGSVVRESELAMAMSATGLLDRVTSYHNMLLKGEKLTPAQRNDFYESTNRILSAAEQHQRKVTDRYRSEAGKWGLDPNSVAPAMEPLMPQRSVRRTGMYQGRRVIEYSDGSVDYAN